MGNDKCQHIAECELHLEKNIGLVISVVADSFRAGFSISSPPLSPLIVQFL